MEKSLNSLWLTVGVFCLSTNVMAECIWNHPEHCVEDITNTATLTMKNAQESNKKTVNQIPNDVTKIAVNKTNEPTKNTHSKIRIAGKDIDDSLSQKSEQ